MCTNGSKQHTTIQGKIKCFKEVHNAAFFMTSIVRRHALSRGVHGPVRFGSVPN